MARLFLCLGKKHGGQVKKKYKIWKLLADSFLDPCAFLFWSGSRVAQAGPEFLMLLPSSLTCWDYMGMCHVTSSALDHWTFFLLARVWVCGKAGCVYACPYVCGYMCLCRGVSLCTEAQSCCVFLDHSHYLGRDYGPRTPSSASLS